MDDKGSCSFRHLQAQGCVLLSVTPVVHVGGHAWKCALGGMGGACMRVYTHIGVRTSQCVCRFSTCVMWQVDVCVCVLAQQ